MANLNHLADFNDSRNSWKLAPLSCKVLLRTSKTEFEIFVATES